MTNLLDTMRFPAALLGELYHRRWRIEAAFKRLQHRLNLEHVTGLSQLAVMQDFAAKIVCDNLQALTVAASHTQTDLAQASALTVLMPTPRSNHYCLHCCSVPHRHNSSTNSST